ncbi:MAG: hypothetical protein RR540_05380 [Oscillospiraceae bacterium]
MKSLLSIFKSAQVSNEGEKVSINNKVKIPIPNAENLSPEEYAEQMRFRELSAEVTNFEQRVAEEVERRTIAIDETFERTRQNAVNEGKALEAKILAEAAAEAEKMKVAAKDEIFAAKEAAKAEGFAEGKAEGLRKCETYLQTGAKFLAEINAKKEAYFISHEDEMLKTVLDMVGKIVNNELKTDKDTIYNILKSAAKAFKNDDYIKISFAEGDVSEKVATDLSFIRTIVGEIPTIDVEILPDAETGTLIIDNGHEILEASVPTQLDLLKEIMGGKK